MSGWDKQRVQELFGDTVSTITLTELGSKNNVGLVIIFDVDAALAAPDLIPDTLAQSLISSAIRAAGPGGSVIALTDDPEQPVLADLFGQRDQLAVARRTYTAAKQAQLPPFGRLVSIGCAQTTAPSTTGWPGQIHGPRRNGREWEILVRIPNAELLTLEPYLTKLRRKGKVRVTVS